MWKCFVVDVNDYGEVIAIIPIDKLLLSRLNK